MSDRKITPNERHLMRLIVSGRDVDGWAKVSNLVAPLIASLPSELLTFERNTDGSGRAKLTREGETVLKWT
jgi:hypothetical protein